MTLKVERSALIFLIDDPAARKLAVAWPLVGFTKSLEGIELERRWAQASGLALNQVRRAGPMLRQHGICQDDGTTHELALQFISSVIAGAIRRRR